MVMKFPEYVFIVIDNSTQSLDSIWVTEELARSRWKKLTDRAENPSSYRIDAYRVKTE